ncbi:hypothetical protein HYH03_013300 [Edaphochlamys debaryana]|uniref:Uncharacterized protein n=1 Tax=Edaphochlamys debaryana TaxID=47281 RepID=A0A836BTJ4_9CHLO|nr:hypothetical protein HYH03_013300 [Edaphochlamys debaryana]|eukprot:KAG2488157.1 hypothetical protein HYH03_013300 [Edaphochlamys debaryana]
MAAEWVTLDLDVDWSRNKFDRYDYVPDEKRVKRFACRGVPVLRVRRMAAAAGGPGGGAVDTQHRLPPEKPSPSPGPAAVAQAPAKAQLDALLASRAEGEAKAQWALSPFDQLLEAAATGAAESVVRLLLRGLHESELGPSHLFLLAEEPVLGAMKLAQAGPRLHVWRLDGDCTDWERAADEEGSVGPRKQPDTEPMRLAEHTRAAVLEALQPLLGASLRAEWLLEGTDMPEPDPLNGSQPKLIPISWAAADAARQAAVEGVAEPAACLAARRFLTCPETFLVFRTAPPRPGCTPGLDVQVLAGANYNKGKILFKEIEGTAGKSSQLNARKLVPATQAALLAALRPLLGTGMAAEWLPRRADEPSADAPMAAQAKAQAQAPAEAEAASLRAQLAELQGALGERALYSYALVSESEWAQLLPACPGSLRLLGPSRGAVLGELRPLLGRRGLGAEWLPGCEVAVAGRGRVKDLEEGWEGAAGEGQGQDERHRYGPRASCESVPPSAIKAPGAKQTLSQTLRSIAAATRAGRLKAAQAAAESVARLLVRDVRDCSRCHVHTLVPPSTFYFVLREDGAGDDPAHLEAWLLEGAAESSGGHVPYGSPPMSYFGAGSTLSFERAVNEAADVFKGTCTDSSFQLLGATQEAVLAALQPLLGNDLKASWVELRLHQKPHGIDPRQGTQELLLGQLFALRHSGASPAAQTHIPVLRLVLDGRP